MMSQIVHEHLIQASSNNDKLVSIIQTNGELNFPTRQKTIADHLCHAIISQQLSKKAATSITNKIKERLNIDDLIFSDLEIDFQVLRECGVSGNKVKSINAVLEKKEYLSKLALQEVDLIIAELTKIWGVGNWTAEMAALFYYRFPDVWSWNDAALSRVITYVEPNVEKQACLVHKFMPYRSFLALHAWKAIDDKVI